MSQVEKLRPIIDNILQLQKLSYTNTMIEEWENKVLGVLEQEYGKDSKHYQQFLYEMRLGYWRPGKGDPRGSASTPKLYQHDYEEQLCAYRSLLFSFLKKP